VLPVYLRNAATASGAVIDYRDWQVPLGRRFRALKLWFVIRHYGVEGLREHVRHHVGLARMLAGWIRDDDDFELVVEPPLSLVCFRHRGGDAVSEAIEQAVNASGKAFLSHTRLEDRYVIRMAIGQTHTEQRHVEAAWAAIRAAGKTIQSAS
jgi:aromatic-L-amino-acid decarboxylase